MVSGSPYQIFCTREIRSIGDLTDRAVALGAASGPPHHAMSEVLWTEGLAIRKEVRIIPISSSGGRLAALETHHVAATTLAPPFSTRAIDRGFKKFAHTKTYVHEDPEFF